MAAGHHGAASDSLEIYGRNLGLAFQLVDDALDYDGRQAALGKNVGDDFRDGKVTMPVVFARDEGDAEERDFWRRVMSGDQREEDLARAQSILKRCDAIVRTLTVARGYADRARAALDGLPRNAFRDALTGLAEFVVERGH
jgi:octaprenyl-diphosphate synthase